MSLALPSLTTYDPTATSEGTLDPLGLYQIADQLATRLVPSVRERMQRIRFLTAIAVGALVTEELEANPEQPEVSPHLVWEWLLVEAFVRSQGEETELLGVPGTLVARRALLNHGYLDFRSYLKTPRVFGFHGVYKRLAIHVGLVDADLRPRPENERLVDAWARDRGLSGIREARPLLSRWRGAIERSLQCRPCRTSSGWNSRGSEWEELASAFLPDHSGHRERHYLRQALRCDGDRALGALSSIWDLQPEYDDASYQEEVLHRELERRLPTTKPLLRAIRAYEWFCRSLEDAFDVIRASAGPADANGFDVTTVSGDEEFSASVDNLHDRFREAQDLLGRFDSSIAAVFDERFGCFNEPTTTAEAAQLICEHHEAIQRGKSAEGKRTWFDRLGGDRIYMRHRYRLHTPKNAPGRYVHDYRGQPIRKFFHDLK